MGKICKRKFNEKINLVWHYLRSENMSIYIYIDESEDHEMFVVGGFATTDHKELMDSIYRTRKFVKNKKGLTRKQINLICNEMKEYQLNRNYRDIKTHLIKSVLYGGDNKKCKQITSIKIFGAYYKKNGVLFNQNTKEDVYIECILSLLSNVVSTFNNDVYVVYDVTYDEFGKSDFDKRLKAAVTSKLSKIENIKPGKSNIIKEIQVADIFAGCIRRSLSNQDMENFTLIKDITTLSEVKLPSKIKK